LAGTSGLSEAGKQSAQT